MQLLYLTKTNNTNIVDDTIIKLQARKPNEIFTRHIVGLVICFRFCLYLLPRNEIFCQAA